MDDHVTLNGRVPRIAAWTAVLLAALVCAACGSGREVERKATGPTGYPLAEELCGTETAWPDGARFVTARQVIRGFDAKTGHKLSRYKSTDIPGARALLRPERSASRFFGDFVVHIVDPHCPALVSWLRAEGEPGVGGLVWEQAYFFGADSLLRGNKRYTQSNIVVYWDTGDVVDDPPRVNRQWSRLDAVLTEIAR